MRKSHEKEPFKEANFYLIRPVYHLALPNCKKNFDRRDLSAKRFPLSQVVTKFTFREEGGRMNRWGRKDEEKQRRERGDRKKNSWSGSQNALAIRSSPRWVNSSVMPGGDAGYSVDGPLTPLMPGGR